jgi:hypothetical protein
MRQRDTTDKFLTRSNLDHTTKASLLRERVHYAGASAVARSMLPTRVATGVRKRAPRYDVGRLNRAKASHLAIDGMTRVIGKTRKIASAARSRLRDRPTNEVVRLVDALATAGIEVLVEAERCHSDNKGLLLDFRE